MGNAIIKCLELSVVTDGTSQGTKIAVDGKVLDRLKSFYLKMDQEDTLVDIEIEEVGEQNNVGIRLIKFGAFDNDTQKSENGGKG